MAYFQNEINLGNVIEVQKFHSRRVGKAVREEAAKNVTPEAQKKWQGKEAVRKVWRLLRNPKNFKPGDLWTTLTYPAKVRPDSETVRRHIKEFLKRLRKAFRKSQQELKYIYSVGRGKQGAIHLHFVLSKIDTEIVQTIWQNVVNKGEYCNVLSKHLDRTQNWHKLAEYIIKNGEETFLSDDPINKTRFSHSRNLVTVKPKRKTVMANKWRKDAPERKGYYIDKNLSYDGHDQYGFPVQYIVYVKINAKC